VFLALYELFGTAKLFSLGLNVFKDATDEKYVVVALTLKTAPQLQKANAK
jgi:hypothetical protein